MSKRAETRALKVYPIHGEWVGNQYGAWDDDINSQKRKTYQEGYEQAEKDIIEIVLHYLNENIHMRCDEKLEWINEFKEAMEAKQIHKETEAGLALTWEDIAKIDAIILDINNKFAVDCSKEINRQSFYEEVLRQFNETFR